MNTCTLLFGALKEVGQRDSAFESVMGTFKGRGKRHAWWSSGRILDLEGAGLMTGASLTRERVVPPVHAGSLEG